MILYAVLDKESGFVELWSEAPVWLDGSGWVGHGYLTFMYGDDLPEYVRDVVSDGKLHEFRVSIKIGEEVTTCR